MATDTTSKKLEIKDILKELGISDLKQQLTTQQKRKLEEYLRQPFDFANATDEEIKNYNDALDFYKGADVGLSKEKNLAEDIYDYVKGLNDDNSNSLNVGTRLNDAQIRQVADTAANKLINGSYSRNEISNLIDGFIGKRGYNGTISWRIENDFKNKVPEYKDTGTFDDSLSATDKSIKDILAQRGQVAESSDYVKNYLSQAPQELLDESKNFFGLQRTKAQDYLKNVFIPGLVKNYDKTGVEFGRGEFNDLVSQKSYQLESTISQNELEQQNSDALIFADMAYKKTLQDLASARGDVRSKAEYDYQTARQKQNQGFVSAQSNINKEFDLSLFRQENENALQAYQKKLREQQDATDKANTAGIFGGIGSAIATGATAGVVNKIAGGSSSLPSKIG